MAVQEFAVGEARPQVGLSANPLGTGSVQGSSARVVDRLQGLHDRLDCAMCGAMANVDGELVAELTRDHVDRSRKFVAYALEFEPDALRTYERDGEWFALMYRTDRGWYLEPIPAPDES